MKMSYADIHVVGVGSGRQDNDVDCDVRDFGGPRPTNYVHRETLEREPSGSQAHTPVVNKSVSSGHGSPTGSVTARHDPVNIPTNLQLRRWRRQGTGIPPETCEP